jgi:hypothetical protein
MQQRNVESETEFGIVNPDESVTKVPPLSSHYKYTDKVYAAYSTYSGKVKDNFGFQVGLRLESSDYNGTMHSSVQDGAGFKDTVSTLRQQLSHQSFPKCLSFRKTEA